MVEAEIVQKDSDQTESVQEENVQKFVRLNEGSIDGSPKMSECL